MRRNYCSMCAGAAALAMVVGVGMHTARAESVVVAPNANADTQGGLQTSVPFGVGDAAFGNGSGNHAQVLYSSSFFGSFGGPQSITGISFRPSDPISSPDTLSISDATI